MFNIVALPRSRTYWLSQFLSTETEEFLHEGCGDFTKNVIGNSLTTPAEAAPFLVPSETIVIERDFKEIIESLAKILPVPVEIVEQLEVQQSALDGIKGYRIPFKDLDDNLDFIWEAVHGTEMDWARAEIMKQENLQNWKLINGIQQAIH